MAGHSQLGKFIIIIIVFVIAPANFIVTVVGNGDGDGDPELNGGSCVILGVVHAFHFNSDAFGFAFSLCAIVPEPYRLEH